MPVIAFPLVSGIQNWNLHGCHCHPKRVLAHIPTWKKLKNHPVAGKFQLQPTPPPLSYTQTHTSNPFSWGQRNPSGGMARRSGPSLKSRCFTQIESFGLREKKPKAPKVVFLFEKTTSEVWLLEFMCLLLSYVSWIHSYSLMYFTNIPTRCGEFLWKSQKKCILY